jgi:hypothetical protein
VTPATVLILTFAGLAVGLFAFFWATTLFLQASLYHEPAPKLPLRAAVAGMLVAGFLTFWTYANTRTEAKDRYGTLFEFNPTASQEFKQFTAIRQSASKQESTVAYQRTGRAYVEVNNPGKSFVRSTSDHLVTALEIPEGDKKVRYDVQFQQEGLYPKGTCLLKEAGGNRYLEMSQSSTLSPVYSPSRSAFFAALGINLLHFVVWFAALWLVLKFTVGHSIGGAICIGLFAMFLLMPLLFEKNKLPEGFKAAPAPASVTPPGEAGKS